MKEEAAGEKQDVSCKNIRLSSDVTNPLSRSRN